MISRGLSQFLISNYGSYKEESFQKKHQGQKIFFPKANKKQKATCEEKKRGEEKKNLEKEESPPFFQNQAGQKESSDQEETGCSQKTRTTQGRGG